ncbi:DedA family protein [Candidatus Peregrinibacteria bacterium]|nr:DedA family protein [Candidatus Peregrinibacteria bacterium]
MVFLTQIIDLFLHLDDRLSQVLSQYGLWTYIILFLIIFCETGLVITPFLPGDSLLFAAGAFAADGALDPWILFMLLSIAAVLGDTVNYWMGLAIGPKIFRENVRFLKKDYLIKTEKFYETHGKKTIIIARFVPIVRTFAPFVAGVGRMKYSTFLLYNVFGGIVWVGLFVFGGYLFGNIPIVQENFEIVILGIIAVSILPGIIEWGRHKMRQGR